MSKSLTSPTARLLQTSRLFSLPRPLPTPDLTGSPSTSQYRASDTATLPYPTHQALATPASSLSRGDWGLKRPLPLKTTKGTSTPTVRVYRNDTFEHITDFASAADHSQTVRKWGEMGIPMIMRPKKDEKGRVESVYEGWVDHTDPEALSQEAQLQEQQQRRRGVSRSRRRQMVEEDVRPRQRWKYAGPWIAGMSEGEFQQFLERRIEGRKGEWREYLRKYQVEEAIKQRRSRARDVGQPLSAQDIEKLKRHLRPTDADLDELEKGLREEHTSDPSNKNLSSTLTALLTSFLDLPTIPNSQSSDPNMSKVKDPLLQHLAPTMIAEEGPPSTHPGAGLSYLRTNAIMENHPLYGPQKYRKPVEARVVRPRTANGPNERNAKLGVGGVVAQDSASATYTSGQRIPEDDKMAHQLDPNSEGGNKLWVETKGAYVSEKGHLHLQLERADRDAVSVKQGQVEAIHEDRRMLAEQNGTRGAGTEQREAAMPSAARAGYNARTAGRAPRSRMSGFDDVVKGDLGERGDGEGAARWIRELGREERRR